jgi:hypothetical protein
MKWSDQAAPTPGGATPPDLANAGRFLHLQRKEAMKSPLLSTVRGFASPLGAIVALTAFCIVLTWSSQLTTWAVWHQAFQSPSVAGFLVVPALLLQIALFMLPFWTLFRLIRLANEWIYPKLFQPLEERI